MKTFIKFMDLLEKILKFLAATLFIVMVGSIFYQIILRYFFASANAWSEELARYTFVWQVMLAAAVGVRHARHMQIDFLVNMFSPKLKNTTLIGLKIIAIWFFYILAQEGTKLFFMTQKQLSTGLEIPMSWIYLSIPVGATMMILFTVEDILLNHMSSQTKSGDQNA